MTGKSFRTLDDIGDVTGKRVLVREDLAGTGSVGTGSAADSDDRSDQPRTDTP